MDFGHNTIAPGSLSLGGVAAEESANEPAMVPPFGSNGNEHEVNRKRKREIDTTTPTGSEVITEPVKPQLTFYGLKSGICYDVRMRYHCKIVTSSNDYVDPHPEDPRRIYRIYKAIAEAGLIRDPTLQGADELGPLMKKIPVRECTEEEILMVHTQKHLDFILSTASMSREQLIHETDHGDSIYLSSDSLMSAKLSCGGTIEICKAVVENQVKNGIAVVRPPGHHAEPHVPGGFCLFSNVAVASQAIFKQYPEQVRRILILDWDVHHGNGTQRAFLDDPRVLYISLHRYENGTFYPGGEFGSYKTVGGGAGAGYSVNIAWSQPGMGDGDYLYAFEKVVMPIAYEFDPDLVIISAGFDAAAEDHLGGCFVSPDGYGQMTHKLMQLANGHLAVVLEGGYNLNAISRSAVAVTKVLLGDPPGRVEKRLPSEYTIRDVDDVISVQCKYWRSLRPSYNAVAPVVDTFDTEKIGTVVRSFQAKSLATKHGLVSLPILKTNQALINMNYQVMASSNIHTKDVIIFIVHDTPEIWAQTDPMTGAIEPNGSKLVDPADKFFQFALDKNFGVVDVVIPGDEPSSSICAQETMVYLWDNYVDYFEATKIVFVGIGKAYGGIVHLAGQRPIKKRTTAILSFIGSHPLKPILPVVDDYTTEWFYKNSVIFTSTTHVAWDTNINPKRPRKKYGRVLKGQEDGVYQLVHCHYEDAAEFIEDSLEDVDEDSG